MRVPLAVNLKINAYTGATITEYDSGITNGIVDKYSDGRIYVTQRPSIDITENASNNTAKVKGRGLYYWETKTAKYIINDDTVYKNSQAAAIGTITSGIDRCQMQVLGSNLAIIDTQNNEGWYVTTGDVLTQITDADFPPNATHSATLCYGGAVLDGYLFVGDTNGILYNSDSNDVSAWTATSYLTAEREPDGGVYVGKHHDNIVFYGVRTTEFFYDDANTVGSPLDRRTDVFYSIGCGDGRSVWEAGDKHFLVGTNDPGARGVYKLENFQLIKISTPDIDSFITQALVKDSFYAIGSGFSANGRLIYLLTLYQAPDAISPYLTLAYDDASGIWGVWETTINSHTKFPIIDWTIRDGSTPQYGEGIFTNGDIFSINDNLTPTETVEASLILEAGIVEPGIVQSTAASTGYITMTIRTGQNDYGTRERKFAGSLVAVGDQTQASQTLTVKEANENNSSFSAGRTIDLSYYQQLNRNGSFRRRNYELSATPTEVVRLEAIEIDL